MRKLFAAAVSVVLSALPSIAGAATTIDAGSTGLTTTGGAAFGSNAQTSLPTFLGTYIIKPVFGIVGTIFFALTVYAGILWMTAQGDPKKVTQAKDILVTSVIGTVIVVSAYVITNAVFSAVTTGTIT